MSSITDSIHDKYTTGIGFSKIAVGDIHIMDDTDVYVYNPKEDITNIDLAYLIRLFSIAGTGSQSGYYYDYWAFVKEKNLTRHFDKK